MPDTYVPPKVWTWDEGKRRRMGQDQSPHFRPHP